MSIFAAEMRGRTTDEDRLISRFFGTIGIADRECVLGSLLADIGVEVARSDLPRIKIEFWQPYFRATPAVLLEGETTLVFVEGLKNIADDRERLIAEFEEGLKGSSHFALVLVTAHAVEPEDVSQLRAELAGRHKSGRVIWASWRTLYKRVHALRTRGELDEVSRRLLSDLLLFLGEQGLAGFVGFSPEGYDKVIEAQRELRSFSRLLQSLIEELTSGLEVYGISPLTVDQGVASMHDGLLVPAHLRLPFRVESWEGVEVTRCHLYLKMFFDSALVWAGYRLDLSDVSQRAFLTEKRGALTTVLESRPGAMLVLQNGEDLSSVARTVRAGEGGLGFLESRDALQGVAHADLVLPFDGEELWSDELPALALERILWLRDQVAEAGLYPTPRGASERRFVVTNL